ncbi:MAG TPA: hypothetical protein VK255_03740 [Patescibacteria group bacterium]|nr:hypothetical protein [Patescibacteria group bacterium]
MSKNRLDRNGHLRIPKSITVSQEGNAYFWDYARHSSGGNKPQGEETTLRHQKR